MEILAAGSKRFLRNPRALNVNWMLTRKCNYTCSYCSVYDNKNGFFPAWEKLDAAVDKIAGLDSDEVYITLAGGEPTLHPDYADLVHAIVNRVPAMAKLLTITNLGRTARYFETLCERIGPLKSKLHFKASFHFDHADVEAYAANARVLAGHGIRLKLAVMAHPERMPEVRAVFDRLQLLATEFPCVTCAAIVIRAKGGIAHPDYSPEDLAWLATCGEVEDRAIYLDQRHASGGGGEPVRSFHAPGEMVAMGMHRFKGMLCNAGRNMLSIDEMGYVSPAVCFLKQPIPKANIFEANQQLRLWDAPVRCEKDACACLADIAIPKFLPPEAALGVPMPETAVRDAAAQPMQSQPIHFVMPRSRGAWGA